MPRVKRGVTSRKRHKKLLKATKGYAAGRGSLIKQAKSAWMKAGLYAYKHRKLKKREFRKLWIVRLNAALKENGVQYSRFIAMLENKDVFLDRKVLSELAIHEPDTFKKVVEFVKA